MAGSRLEKFGTIYKRVHGLLKSGAMKSEDVPMWYRVYEAFPPRDPPVYERRVPRREIPKILYPEDMIRVQFYKTYGNPDVIDLTNEKVKTTCQRFVDTYMELLQTDTPRENLFEATASALKEQGIRLRTSEEVESDTTPSAAAAPSLPPPVLGQRLSVASIFGEKTVKEGEADEQDYIIEEDIDKKT